eukprot:6350735-Pyramimonas_sp.AAC.1
MFSNRVAIGQVGETVVALHPEFKLFMTTRMASPMYPPELLTKLVLVNWVVTLVEVDAISRLIRVKHVYYWSGGGALAHPDSESRAPGAGAGATRLEHAAHPRRLRAARGGAPRAGGDWNQPSPAEYTLGYLHSVTFPSEYTLCYLSVIVRTRLPFRQSTHSVTFPPEYVLEYALGYLFVRVHTRFPFRQSTHSVTFPSEYALAYTLAYTLGYLSVRVHTRLHTRLDVMVGSLQVISSAEGDLLEDDSILATLADSRRTSADIKRRLKQGKLNRQVTKDVQK